MEYRTFVRLYKMASRLLGYGSIAVGLAVAFTGYASMLARLDAINNEPNKLWERHGGTFHRKPHH